MSEAVTTRQQELAGKYRPYPEYKDSGVVWLGEMPSTWVLAKTARYFKIAMGQTILKEQLEDDGEWPVYSATEGDHYFGRVNNPQVRLGCGDLVIPARGNSIGFVKLVKEQVTTTQTTIYCKHLTQKIYPEYAYYFMVGQKENLFWFTQTAIPQITVEEIGSNPILLPSFEEQRTIAAFLDYETARIDRLIAQQQRLIELLKEKRQAVISHAVTKGLNPNAPMKDSGVEWLGQVPEHWDVCLIKFKCDGVTDGAHISPVTEGGQELFVSIKDIEDGKIDFDNALLTSPDSYQYLVKTGCQPFAGDILFSKDGTIGQTAVTPEGISFVVASSLIIIRPNRDVVRPSYLNFLLQSCAVKEQVESFVKGAALRRLSIQNLLKVFGAFPDVYEQDAISRYLGAVLANYSELESKAREAISLMQERRTALISAAVTGKIDLRGWTQPAEEVAA